MAFSSKWLVCTHEWRQLAGKRLSTVTGERMKKGQGSCCWEGPAMDSGPGCSFLGDWGFQQVLLVLGAAHLAAARARASDIISCFLYMGGMEKQRVDAGSEGCGVPWCSQGPRPHCGTPDPHRSPSPSHAAPQPFLHPLFPVTHLELY